MSVVLRQDSNSDSVSSSISMMEQISFLPSEMLNLIPRFGGDKRELNLFLRQCEYVINKFMGDETQNTYVLHAITSKLDDNAAALISERDDVETWEQLKGILTQHFGDHRTEELIFMELDNLKIEPHESYVDLYNRIKSVRSTLLSKVSKLTDPAMKQYKTLMINENSLNVFLYNLPIELVRTVRLSKPRSLEDALGVVIEEVNFFERYAAKNNLSTKEINKFIRPSTQFRFGIPNQNVPDQPYLGYFNYIRSSGAQLFGQPQVKLPNVDSHTNHLFSVGKPQAIGTSAFGSSKAPGASSGLASTNTRSATTFGSTAAGTGLSFGGSVQSDNANNEQGFKLKKIEFNNDNN